MSYQLVFHPEADREYVEAYQWYEKEQKGLGARFEKMVGLYIQKIIDAPENNHYGKPPYRFLLQAQFNVVMSFDHFYYDFEKRFSLMVFGLGQVASYEFYVRRMAGF